MTVQQKECVETALIGFIISTAKDGTVEDRQIIPDTVSALVALEGVTPSR